MTELHATVQATISALSNRLFICLAVVAAGIFGDTRVYAQSSSAGWTNRYQGPGSSAGHSIAVDGDGNVVVTGYSFDRPLNNNGFPSPAFRDYATIKYSNTGLPLWTNPYDGPGNQYDEACGVTVDSKGDVLVTGSSYGGTVTHNDYLTIKYSSSGVPLWTNRYNGPGDGEDSAKAVAVDGNDSVVVTGLSVGTDGRADYLTIKYSSAGVPLWTNRYGARVNGVDIARALALDASGNVFVTGESDSEGRDDYLTIKYSSTGVPLWTNRYNGPANSVDQASALVVDSNGDVVVTGVSWNGEGSAFRDYLTIKYSSAGVPLWTNRYNGPGNDVDVARAVAVDASGNVFVTGYSHSGNAEISADYATINYSSAGVPLWTNRYDGPAQWADRAKAIAVDRNGDVFVTGGSFSATMSPLDFDYATIKYSNAGVPLWTNRYSGPGLYYDAAHAIAVDGSGNVFVTGQSWNANTDSSDYVTIKYSSTGLPLLTIARTTTNTLAVSWPLPAVDFTLQQTTNVASTNWSAVSTAPDDDGTNRTVIVDPLEGNRFYRLFHP